MYTTVIRVQMYTTGSSKPVSSYIVQAGIQKTVITYESHYSSQGIRCHAIYVTFGTTAIKHKQCTHIVKRRVEQAYIFTCQRRSVPRWTLANFENITKLITLVQLLMFISISSSVLTYGLHLFHSVVGAKQMYQTMTTNYVSIHKCKLSTN